MIAKANKFQQIYFFKVKNEKKEKKEKMYEICSKLTVKTPERRLTNLEKILDTILVIPLLTLNK